MRGVILPFCVSTGLSIAVFAQRPQEPRPPYPYSARDVTFDNKTAGIRLAGTLTLPPGKGPFPAVALISGSGRQNRDDAIFGHKPFLLVSDYLTRRGIVVLRYDDRGEGDSQGDYDAATTADLSWDAEAAFEYLKTRPEVETGRIGLAGHSEGGAIAAMVAARNPRVAFVISLAGGAVPGGQILHDQGLAIRRAQGASQADLDAQDRRHGPIMAAFGAPDPARALREIFGDSPGAEAQIKAMLGPWMRFFITYDPSTAIAKVKCPVLAMNGERDLQVIPDPNLNAWEAALRKAGNKDFTVRRLPGLNHLFQTCEDGLPEKYGEIEETMSPIALDTMASWILKRFARGSPMEDR